MVLLERPVFFESWQALFSNEKNVPSWLAKFTKTGNGVVSPGEKITLGGQSYLTGNVCKPHDCDSNQFYVLFTENGEHAWGLLIVNFKTERFFNKPDTEKQTALRAIGQ